MDRNTGADIGNGIADFIQASLWAVIGYWFLSAIVAGAIAGDRNRSFIGWFGATFFFLGPLGVGFALLATRGEMDRPPIPPAPAKRPISSGRRRFLCLRCGAESDVRDAETSFTCWRCDEVCTVKAKVTAAEKS